MLLPVGGTEESFVASEVAEEHQFSDAEETYEEDDDNEEADEETIQSSASSVRMSVCGEGPGCQPASNPVALVKTNESRRSSLNTPSTSTAAMSSSPICSLSPGLHLSPGRTCSPRGDVSPLRCLSPRLSSSPCQTSLSPSTRPVSPFSSRHLSPVRAISPICPVSPSSLQSSSFGASVTVQQRAYRLRDSTKSSTNTVNSNGKLVGFIFAGSFCAFSYYLTGAACEICPGSTVGLISNRFSFAAEFIRKQIQLS